MNDRLKHITVGPTATIRDAMRTIDEGPRMDPPSPSGIVIVMEGEMLLGIATDGDIRGAILNGKSLEEPISSIMTREPLTVRFSPDASTMLSRLYEEIKKRNTLESKFHNILVTDSDGKLMDIVTPFELWRRSEVKIKTVAVIGLGYVGLTLALTLNEFGIKVVGIDTNADVIEKLKKGEPHFYEKGLESLLRKHANKNLILKQHFDKNESDVYIVCVGTPVDANGRVTKVYLQQAVTEVSKVLKTHDLIILRSTVPIGTCRKNVIPLLEETSGLSAEQDFFLAFAPERTVEGKALEELRSLPQVIGGYNQQSLEEASKLFRVFTQTIVAVDSLEDAEAVKLLNNTFRDVSFSFANEIAQVCDGFGLNARDVIRAANEGYTRNPIPEPSPGVGGACLVKDPFILIESAREVGREAKLPMISREINTAMIDFVVRKVDDFINKTGKDPAVATIFLMGMAFKGYPETSDIRHSTSVDILRKLQDSYSNIRIYYPIADKSELQTLGATVVNAPEEGFAHADCALVLTNHPSFRDLEIFGLASQMRQPGLIMDTWGLFRPEQLSSLEGIQYTGL